jgi:diguanylate cyclase (GGDEF)-like protein
MTKALPITIIEYVGCRSKASRIAVGIGLFSVVTALKFFSGPEVVFSAIYLIPISFMTWFGSGVAGVLTSAASASSLLLINLADVHKYSHIAIPYWNASMDFGVFLIVVFILSEAKGLYRREKELSREDFATGVQNRRAFFETVTAEIVRTRRYGHPITIAYLDLDDFKQVNDRYGHRTGDLLLSVVAQVMQNSVREADLVARLGGDEFVLLFPETGAGGAQPVLETVQRNLRDAMATHRWPVTFSIGAVTFLSPLDSADEMIEMTDQVMYSAKQAGKNRVLQHVLGTGGRTGETGMSSCR